MDLLQPARLTLRRNDVFTSQRVAVDHLAATLTVRIRRPTTASPLTWDESSKLRVTLIVEVDGAAYRVTGTASGGIRSLPGGPELGEYRLRYALPVQLGEKGREFMRGRQPDTEGYYHDVPLTRVAEEASTIEAYVQVEHLTGGAIDLDILGATCVDAPPPTVRTKNSVAFDATTAAQEMSGDGVVTLSHTSTGSDRGVWAAVANASGVVPQLSTSVTYGAMGLTERADFDLGDGSFAKLACYTGKGQATGAQTVTSTIAGATNDHVLHVVSFTGVDQTTEVGAVATATGASSPATVAVGSVGADDMVVDAMWHDFTSGAPTIGADQTQRAAEDVIICNFRGSTQPGTAGGVMSWTLSGSSVSGIGWGSAAIAFKPAGGAAPAAFPFRRRDMRIVPLI